MIAKYQVINAGTVSLYNTAGTDDEYGATFDNLHIQGENIYLNDSLIATCQQVLYNTKKKQNGNDKYFIVKSRAGLQVAALLVSKSHSNIQLWIGDDPKPLFYVTKDISEDKMINVAIQILLIKNILQ